MFHICCLNKITFKKCVLCYVYNMFMKCLSMRVYKYIQTDKNFLIIYFNGSYSKVNIHIFAPFMKKANI